MKRSLLLGVTLVCLSITIVGIAAAGNNPVEDIYTQIVQKMDEIKTAIENQELNPTVNVENTVNVPGLEPQMAYSVEEVVFQYNVVAPDYGSLTNFHVFSFPDGKEWQSITVTRLTVEGYISDPGDASESDGFININGVTVASGVFYGLVDADPSVINAGTNTMTLWADADCVTHLERIVIEYQIMPAN